MNYPFLLFYNFFNEVFSWNPLNMQVTQIFEIIIWPLTLAIFFMYRTTVII